MHLAKIELENFRSYRKNEFDFHPQGCLIIGPNGSGKTNLLEAIAYCSIGKSIRFHYDEELLNFEGQFFRVAALFLSDQEIEQKVTLTYAEQRKLLKLDDLPVRQLSTLFEVVKVIYCAPEDHLLISGPPRFRRQYFDLAISQLYPPYITVLRNFLHLVQQRNAMLKRNYSSKELSSWNLAFATSLAEVWKYRNRYLQQINSALKEAFKDIFPASADITIGYLSSLKLPLESPVEDIIKQLAALEEREKMLQRSIVGAHLDDYEFKLQEHRMRIYASQGQKRIAVIILKLLQAHLIERITGIKPILLFDDIFAELDTYHSLQIRNCINNHYQVFISSPKEDIRNIWQGYPVKYLEGIAQ